MCSTVHETTANLLQVLSLESKCKDFQVNIAALREEISERESVIAQNYSTIQLLRRRLADMEKHKFVLGYRTQVSLPTAVPRNPGCQSVRDTSLLAAFALLFCNKQLLYPVDDCHCVISKTKCWAIRCIQWRRGSPNNPA